MTDLVTIIMAAYNAEKYIGEAIDSVLNQSHQNWELLVINDGSADHTQQIIDQYNDPRIRSFQQENKGVSAARNIGLDNMQGDYFCFLDSDDLLPANSLETRFDQFKKNDKTSFVDGGIINFKNDLKKVMSKWNPQAVDNLLEDLVSLTGKSFFGVTWMIRRLKNHHYQFDTQLTHGEDLWFYIQIAQHGQFDFSNHCTYYRRLVTGSAMSNLKALDQGYKELSIRIAQLNIDKSLLKKFEKKSKSIMIKSYLGQGQIISALKRFFES